MTLVHPGWHGKSASWSFIGEKSARSVRPESLWERVTRAKNWRMRAPASQETPRWGVPPQPAKRAASAEWHHRPAPLERAAAPAGAPSLLDKLPFATKRRADPSAPLRSTAST